MKRKYLIFRCKCCGSSFHVLDNTEEYFQKDEDVIHICDENTSLIGFSELVGATDYGRDLKDYYIK